MSHGVIPRGRVLREGILAHIVRLFQMFVSAIIIIRYANTCSSVVSSELWHLTKKTCNNSVDCVL